MSQSGKHCKTFWTKTTFSTDKYLFFLKKVLTEYLNFSIDLAKQAGALIKEGVDKRLAGSGSIMAKYSNPSDMVTETDQAVEAFVKEKISAAYPSHKYGFLFYLM